MKYLSQFCMILGFTLAGEALQRLLPLPIPASVWGLALLFLALCFGIVKPEQVKDAAAFLISIMALLFHDPAAAAAHLSAAGRLYLSGLWHQRPSDPAVSEERR